MMKNKVVIQTGFAENFKTQIQNAIQSSYWASKQVTIFIVCVWEQNGCHSLMICLDYLSHNKYAMVTSILMILTYSKTVRTFSKIEMFSDSARHQFNERFTMYVISLVGISLTVFRMDFLGAAHEWVKGGVGGKKAPSP